eukprot:scaffold6638_cov127-Cylindrotheca_fusiformis.AAC.11
MADYDGSVFLDRKLTDEEVRELKIILFPYFHSAGGLGGDEDITDFLDYTFAMVSNSKTVDYIVKELLGMEMEFCNEEVGQKVAREIANFVTKLNGGPEEKNEEKDNTDGAESSSAGRVVSLKASVLLASKDMQRPFPANLTLSTNQSV